MSGDDVHCGEMHDEPLAPPVAAFLDEVRSVHANTPLPEPGPVLAALFSSGIAMDESTRPVPSTGPVDGPVEQAAGTPKTTKGPQMLKKVLGSLAGKATAAVAGAALAIGGLGVAGALPEPVLDVAGKAASVVGLGDASTEEASGGDTTIINANHAVSTPTVGVPGEGRNVESMPAPPGGWHPVTSVSEAAQYHGHDEYCGNHGAWVSYFARTGTPGCAVRGDKQHAGDDRTDGDGDERGAEKDAAKAERGAEKDAAKAERDAAKAERDAAKEQAEAERQAADEEGESERRAAKDRAEKERQAAKDRAKANRDGAKGGRGGPGR